MFRSSSRSFVANERVLTGSGMPSELGHCYGGELAQSRPREVAQSGGSLLKTERSGIKRHRNATAEFLTHCRAWKSKQEFRLHLA